MEAKLQVFSCYKLYRTKWAIPLIIKTSHLKFWNLPSPKYKKRKDWCCFLLFWFFDFFFLVGVGLETDEIVGSYVGFDRMISEHKTMADRRHLLIHVLPEITEYFLVNQSISTPQYALLIITRLVDFYCRPSIVTRCWLKTCTAAILNCKKWRTRKQERPTPLYRIFHWWDFISYWEFFWNPNALPFQQEKSRQGGGRGILWSV